MRAKKTSLVKSNNISIERELLVDSDDVAELPRTDIEIEVARIWSDILNCEIIAIKQSFFTLGGDSVTAARMLSRIEAVFRHSNIVISLEDFSFRPTIQGLAALIELQQNEVVQVCSKETLDTKRAPNLDANTIKIMPGKINDPDDIIFAGATSFLGCFLLQEILANTFVNVYCLVRANSEQEGMQYLLDNGKNYALDFASYQSRIHIMIIGDLSMLIL